MKFQFFLSFNRPRNNKSYRSLNCSGVVTPEKNKYFEKYLFFRVWSNLQLLATYWAVKG